MGRRGKVRFMVFFGDEDPEGLNDIDTWRPMTVGCYVNLEHALNAIRTDVSSPWHEGQDFTMLYRGTPGGKLEFLGRFKSRNDLLEYLRSIGKAEEVDMAVETC